MTDINRREFMRSAATVVLVNGMVGTAQPGAAAAPAPAADTAATAPHAFFEGVIRLPDIEST